jgi:hypothetical protein
MRGDHEQQAPMWSYISPEQRIPQNHPLRPIRALVDAVLHDLSPCFKRVEEIFGWLKTVALLRQTRYRGRARVGWMFLFGLAAYNLIRIRNLTWAPA